MFRFQGKAFNILIILMALVAGSPFANASHLMGGDFSYKWLSTSTVTGLTTYELVLKVYRDCGQSTGLDNAVTINAYNSSNNSYVKNVTYNLYTTQNVVPSCIPSNTVCIEEGTYKGVITLPNSTTNGYTLSWGRCCRNSAITNLASPGSTGQLWAISIPPTNITNASPYFLNPPLPYLCQGRQDYFNHNANDPDGDSLVFSFATPYKAGNNTNCVLPSNNRLACGNLVPSYPVVTWGTGYSLSFPLGTGSSLSINSQTGEITATANTNGNFVVAVAVKEFRRVTGGAAILLGEVRRDIQFIVKTCTGNSPPAFLSVQGGVDQTVTAGDTLCFTISGRDSTGDSVFITKSGPIFDGSGGIVAPYATLPDTDADSVVSAQFCWVPDCPHARAAPYIFTVTLADNYCNSSQKTFTITVNPKNPLSPPDIRCADILNDSVVQISWNRPSFLKDFENYYIYRRDGLSGSFALIDSVADSTFTTFQDTLSGADSIVYSYYIRTGSTCKVKGGLSDSISTLILSGGQPVSYIAQLNWNVQSSNRYPMYKIWTSYGSGYTLRDSTRSSVYYLGRCDKSISFQVTVSDSIIGCSSNSNTTPSLVLKDTFPPQAPKLLVASKVTDTGAPYVEVKFRKSDSLDIKEYRIYYSENGFSFTFGGYGTVTGSDSIGSGTMSIGNGLFNNHYSVYVRAVDSCGNLSSVDGVPSLVRLSSAPGNMSSLLTWSSYSGFVMSGYTVQRLSGSSWATIGSVSTSILSFKDSVNIGCNKTYAYRVLANEQGGSYFSVSDTVMVTPFDTIKPPPPDVLVASVVSNSSIDVVFNKSTAPDVNRYQVFYSINGGFPTSAGIITNPSANPVTFTHTGINTLLNTYCYYVIAIDSCANNTSVGNETHCASQLLSAAGNLKSLLTWSPYIGFNVSNYTVQKLVSGTWTNIGTAATSTMPYYIDSANLGCNFTYAYRIAANEQSGTNISYSDTVMVIPFDTIKPPAPDVNYVTVASNSSIEVIFSKSTAPDVNKYQVFYSVNGGTFSSAAILTNPAGNPVTFTHTGLNTLKNIYCYYVTAIDSCANNTSVDNDTNCAVQLTAIPGNLASVLSWTAYSGFIVDDYSVEMLIGGVWTSPGSSGTVGGSTFSYIDSTNLVCNRTYAYRIAAYRQGSSIISYSDTVMVTPFDTIKPPPPNLQAVSVVVNSSMSVLFSKSTAPDVNKYEIFYSVNGGSFSSAGTRNNIGTDPLTFTHTGINPGQNTYCYYMTAIDSCSNNTSVGNETHCAVQLTSTPGNLSSLLNWSPYSGFGTYTYSIQELIGGIWTNIASVNSSTLSYKDSVNIGCNQTYAYRVMANEGGTAVSYSDTAMVTPFDTIKPFAPDVKVATVTSNSSIDLTFIKSVSPDVTRYEVFYSVNGGTFSSAGILTKPAGNPVTFTHSGINALKNTYCYYVTAIDSCASNTSVNNETHCAVQLTSAPGNLASQLTWTAYSGYTVSSYEIERFLSGSWTNIGSVNATTFTFKDSIDIGCNQVYPYRILAKEQGGSNISWSDTVIVVPFDTIKPLSPTIINVTVLTGNRPQINWIRSASPDVKNYIIHRFSGSGILSPIDTVGNDTTYTDISVSASDTSWCYAIQAMDSCAGNRSQLTPTFCTINLKPYYAGCRPIITFTWNKFINWPGGVTSYEVYRAVNGSAETLIKTLAATDSLVIDTVNFFNIVYQYRVKAIENKITSPSSSWSDQVDLIISYPEGPFIEYASKIITGITNGKVEVRWDPLFNNPYAKFSRLYYSPTGSAPFTLLQDSIPNSQRTFTHSNLNTSTADHWYYMTSVDSCDNLSDSVSLHKTIDIQLQGGQLTNLLKWTRYKGWAVQNYIIQRNNGSGYTNVDSIAGTDTAYTDFPAPCNSNIYYRIAALSSQGFMSYSDSAGTQAIDTIPADPPTIVNATVLADSVVRIDFKGADSLDIYGYSVQRSKNGGAFTGFKFIPFTAPQLNYTVYDSTDALGDHNCYQVVSLDSCLNATASSTFCVVQLRGTAEHLANRLDWFAFKGYAVATYDIELFNGLTWNLLKTVPGTDTSWVHDSLLCNIAVRYRIITHEAGGARISNSDTAAVTPFDSVPPAAVTMKYVSVISNTQVRVEWKPNSPDALVYELQRKTANGSWQVVVALGSNDTIFTDNTLNTLDSVYCYQIIAIDSCAGNRSLNNSVHCTMELKGDPLNMANRIYWNPYVGFSSISKFRIQRLQGGVWVNRDSVAGNITNYTDQPLPCNATYNYRVIAVDGTFGYSSISDTIYLRTYDTIPPQAPFLRKVTVAGPTTVQVFFDSVPDPDVNRYQVFYSVNGGSFTSLGFVNDNGTNPLFFSSNGLNTLSNQYSYYIKAIDTCAANTSPASITHSTVELQGSNGNLASLLNWKRYAGFSAFQYEVQRIINGSWTTIGTLPSSDTAYIDSAGLGCNIPYYYRIKTQQTSGAGEFSYSDTLQVIPFDTLLPPQPDLLYASVINGNTAMEIKFSNSTDPDVKTYQIFVSIGAGSYLWLATLNRNAADTFVTYIHTGINAVTDIHRYYVLAIDSCASNVSILKEYHVPVNLIGTPGNLRALLRWPDYNGFQTMSHYWIERQQGSSWILLDSIPYAGYAFYTDSTGLGCNQPYTYRVRIKDATTAYYSYSNTITVTPYDSIPPAPPVLNYVSVISSSQTQIGWSPSASTDVKDYEIWRSTDGGPFSMAGTVSSVTQFVDNGLAPGTENYGYLIIAIDSCNQVNRSIPSDTDYTINLSSSTYECVPLVRLKWNEYATFNNGPMGGYAVFRSENGGPAGSIASLNPGTTAFTDTTVILGNDYCYAIAAMSSGGTYVSFSNSNCIRPTEIQLTDTARLVMSTVTQTGITTGEIQLSWERKGFSDTIARGYRIFHSNVSANGPYTLLHDEADLNVTSFTHTNVNTSTVTNYYSMAVYDLCNKITDSARVHSPVNISLANGNLSTLVSWTPYLGWDNLSYRLQKADSTRNFYDLFTFGKDTLSFVDNSVLCKHLYYYRVIAVRADTFMLSYSDEDSIVAEDLLPPPQSDIYLASVIATGQTNGSVNVLFDASTETNRSGYNIYRSVNGGPYNFHQAYNNMSSGVLTYTDNNINTRDNVHSYMVTVTDSCGNESFPAFMHTVVNLSGNAVNRATNINWTAYKGFNGYQYSVERLDPLSVWQQIALLPSTVLSFTDSGTSCNNLYSYRIAVLDSGSTLISYSDTITVSSFENEIPLTASMRRVTVTATGQLNGRVLVSWDHSVSPDAGGYILDYRIAGSSFWTNLAMLGYVNSYTAISLNTSDYSYEFRLAVADSCGNISPYSATHATVNLTLIPGNQKMTLDWNNYQGWAVDSFEIYRSGSLLARVGANIFNYVDTPLSCRDIYTYRIVVYEMGGNKEISESDTVSAVPIDLIPTAASYIKTATVEVFNDEVKIEWTRVSGFDVSHYELQRKLHNQWKTVFTSTADFDTLFTDKIPEDASLTPYCYRIYAYDKCGNKSAVSNDACLIKLSGSSGKLSSDLSWTAYHTWMGGVKSYSIYRSDDSNSWNLLGTVGSDTLSFRDESLVNDIERICYIVIADEDSGSFDAVSRSNKICLVQQPVFWLPTAFSPGSTYMLNDEFGPVGTFIANYELSIFNRWGQVMFKSSSGKMRWDGKTPGGDLVPDGVYIYTIKVLSYDGNRIDGKGTVTILK